MSDVRFVSREEYRDAMQSLYEEGYRMCIDVTAVDYLNVNRHGRTLPDGGTPERFEVVINLLDLDQRRRVRVRVQVPESDPTVPSLFALWPGTEAMEREVWDMFGIAFDGHPDLTRILMPEDWEGHPLRKDYAIVQGVDQIVPVDVYAPGCPPNPETLLHAILTLHEKIRTGHLTRRPA